MLFMLLQKYYKIKEKKEKQGCGRNILVIFRKKKSNLEVVLLLLVLLAHILQLKNILYIITYIL